MTQVADYDNVPSADQDEEDEGGDKPSPGANGDAHKKDGKGHIGGTQAGILEMSTLITQPGLKRAESMEILHLTLHQCARDGNPDNMRRLLASLGNRKKKVNLHDDEHLSALHYASRYNHVHLVKMLVDAGADVMDVDDEGATPLHFAARYKRVRLRSDGGGDAHEPLSWDDEPEGDLPELQSTPENSVILNLVQQGADVNARDIYGCTPLHFASMRGNELATQELLSCKGINIEAVDKQQMTAIHLAASHNETEICRMLIDKGSNLRCCDEDMCTPLHYACMEGNVKVASLLFEAGEKQDGWVTVSAMVTDQDNGQNTSLHLAVEHKSFNVAQLCIDKGADVNTPSDNYSTPLHSAAVVGDVKITRLLLDHGARIDALDINQSTPLHRGAAYNHAEVCEFLLERGAKIDKHDKDNFTPLLIAACNGHADTIKTLLSHGADLFAVDKNDKTAIFWAAEEDNVEALQTLLGQNPGVIDSLRNEDDRFGNTPLHIAATKGHVASLRALLDAGADLDAKNEEEQTPLHLAAKNGKTNVVRELVKRDKMTINDEDEDSNTPLHLAALAGHEKAVVALIEAGAFIDARNCSLWTPLDCSAAKGWVKTCKKLLEADAPIDPMDKTKTTPIHLASARGHVQVVSLLLQWSASASQRDTEGRNCLDLAIDNGHQDVAMSIINSSKWREALRNETIDLKTGLRNTPMRKLIRKMPDVAERVFNQCTTQNVNNQDAINYQITFNYEFLDDMYADWREVSDTGSDAMSTLGSIYDEDNVLLPTVLPYTKDTTVLKLNHPLMCMVRNDQEDLLAHPLVTSLLTHKWNSFGRYVYYFGLSLYILFLVFLTGYIVNTKAPYEYFNITRGGYNGSICEAVRDYYDADADNSISQDLFAYIGKYVIMAMAAFNILREIFQMYNAKLNYLGWENLIEWVTYVCALLLVIDWNQCQQETGIREDWQWQIAAVAVFLAWLELVLFIRKFPRFGIYVVMFTDVLITFLQFFPVFLLFLVAFSLAFYVLLANQYAFRHPEYSMIKTTVMMIGEMEFQDLFFGTEDVTDPEELHKNKVYYEPLTYVLYVVFLVIMTILIMNLLVGLAVDDIKAVQEQAVLKRLAMQVELALDVESLLPQFIRRKFVIKCKKIEPNAATSNPFQKCFKLNQTMSSQELIKALNPELDDMEVLQENQEKLLGTVNSLRYRLKQMESQNQKVTAMLTAIIKHQGIKYDEEDVQEDEFQM